MNEKDPQSMIERIQFCFDANVAVAAQNLLDKHELYDQSAGDLRQGIAFFRNYLKNVQEGCTKKNRDL